MMVLRHIRPPLLPPSTVVTDPENDLSPIDLSNKHQSVPSEVKPQGSHHQAWRTNQRLAGHRSHDGTTSEDEDYTHRSGFIPLSRIQARYNHHRHDDSDRPESGGVQDEVQPRSHDKVLTKRARLDCLISHIKQSKPDHQLPESFDESGTTLRSALTTQPSPSYLGLDRFRIHASEEDEEPCNLACPKRPTEGMLMTDHWKSSAKGLLPLSPTEVTKGYGLDPENYQQHMMQLQLSQAALMADNGGVKGYPPFFLLYYSQMIHQAQVLRHIAMQTNSTSTVIPEDKSPSTPRSTLGASGYNCQSPLSPASLSEGHLGVDSDGGSVGGHVTSGSLNGKRAPRAMTGRHVRTGTGASPATLQTLRLKIEERQRLKAQQLRSGSSLGSGGQSMSKSRNGTTTCATTLNHTVKVGLNHKKKKSN